MPTYVYRFVDTDETIEIQQSFSDPTLTEAVHPDSGKPMPVKKVFQPVGVTFKGDGFYKTDSRSNKKSAATANGSTTGGSESKADTSSTGDSGSKSDSGSKADSGSTSDSGSKSSAAATPSSASTSSSS